ncbi:MAG: NCS1 family nucleobase:cation symporter-1, partial [Chthoniobacterales bacterium]
MHPAPKNHDPHLWNEDLAPVPQERRTWTTWNVAALWVGMAVCIPTYMLAAGLIQQGMNWSQALLVILLGNLIVLVPMTLNAHPGTKYGIPFPVLLRASFGPWGSNIPALMRGIVACGWFGIQTWVGGAAIYATASVIFGFDPSERIPLPILGISGGEFTSFMLFWAINVYFILRGMDSIKWLEALSAPFLLIVGLVLVWWAWSAADGFGPIFAQPSRLDTAEAFWPIFGAGLTAMVGYWATLSLNIPDFSRYARSQRAQIAGQAIGLPATMTLYSFVGIIVTSATVVIFGEALWDPVKLIARLGSPLVSAIALVVLAVATLSTNIAANVVSPANDFSNLNPRRISFRTGGLITAFVGLFMFPWKLYEDPSGYIFTWLIGYSALLGPIAGIMIADYFVYRRRHLEVDDLYRSTGAYRYSGGFSLVGFTALFLAILPNLPGFLVEVRWAAAETFPAWLVAGYHYAWFVGFALAFLLYSLL